MTIEKTVKLSNDELSNIATDLVRKAEAESLTLKVIGGLGAYICCSHREEILPLYGKVNRLGKDGPTFADLDLIGFSKQQKQIQDFLVRMGYEPDRYVNALFAGSRNVFSHKDHGFHVDIFYDMLNFSHDVVLVDKNRNRLRTGSVTIFPTDLLLSKIQVHDVTRKDLVDIVLLLMGHDISQSEGHNSIDSNYVSSILADDWGFHYDAVSNLIKARDEATAMASDGTIGSHAQKDVSEKIDYLLKSIESFPKTRSWEKRAKKGTSKQWYREVDEI